MFQPMPARWLAVSSALLVLTVSAQTPATPAARAAASAPVAQTQTTPGQYRSALESYQPYSENKMVPWKEANDTVGKIGGWRVYAKEAAEGGTANPHAGDGKAEETKK